MGSTWKCLQLSSAGYGLGEGHCLTNSSRTRRDYNTFRSCGILASRRKNQYCETFFIPGCVSEGWSDRFQTHAHENNRSISSSENSWEDTRRGVFKDFDGNGEYMKLSGSSGDDSDLFCEEDKDWADSERDGDSDTASSDDGYSSPWESDNGSSASSTSVGSAADSLAIGGKEPVYQVLEVHPGGEVVQREVSRRQLLRSIAGLRLRDICSVDPSLWVTNSVPAILVRDQAILLNLGSTAVLQSIDAEAKKELTPIKLRKKAAQFALKTVNEQCKAFKRHGVWENPYLTLNPDYEAAQIIVFGKMFLNGHIYRGRKPVHWSPPSGIALVEVELEYPQGHTSTSIYVAFKMTDLSDNFPESLKSLLPSLGVAIWTTTPWTIPGNAAVALNDQLSYAVVEIQPFAPAEGESKNFQNRQRENKKWICFTKSAVEFISILTIGGQRNLLYSGLRSSGLLLSKVSGKQHLNKSGACNRCLKRARKGSHL